VVREGLEVLHCGCKVELITGSAWTPQAKSFKAVVAFEVGELHLDLFALVARLLVFRRSHERASDIACVLVHVVHDPPMRHVRAALRFERTNLTVADRGEVTERMIGADVTGRGQRLAGRTRVDVLLFVECEVGSAECTVIACSLVPDRDVGGDTGVNHEAEKLARPIRGIRHQAIGLETKRALGTRDHHLGALHLVIRARRCRFDIDNDGVLDIDQVVQPISELHALVGLCGPGRGRVGERNNLRWLAIWAGLRIEARNILCDGSGLTLRRRPVGFLRRDAVIAAGVGLNDAGIDREALAFDEWRRMSPSRKRPWRLTENVE